MSNEELFYQNQKFGHLLSWDQCLTKNLSAPSPSSCCKKSQRPSGRLIVIRLTNKALREANDTTICDGTVYLSRIDDLPLEMNIACVQNFIRKNKNVVKLFVYPHFFDWETLLIERMCDVVQNQITEATIGYEFIDAEDRWRLLAIFGNKLRGLRKLTMDSRAVTSMSCRSSRSIGSWPKGRRLPAPTTNCGIASSRVVTASCSVPFRAPSWRRRLSNGGGSRG